LILADVAAAFGKGLFAGLAGTAAVTLSQQIEMKFSEREPSIGPGDMAADLLGVEPKGQKERESFSNLVHWTWGTVWGVPRGFISLAGPCGRKAAATHAGVILGVDFWILHTLKVAPPAVVMRAGGGRPGGAAQIRARAGHERRLRSPGWLRCRRRASRRGAVREPIVHGEKRTKRRPDASPTTRLLRALIAPGEPSGAFYMASNRRLYGSRNAGESWQRLELDWPERYQTQHPGTLIAVG